MKRCAFDALRIMLLRRLLNIILSKITTFRTMFYDAVLAFGINSQKVIIS